MKRKKYIKQLMALGIDRNGAHAMAYLCRTAGKTYEADYRARAPWLRLQMAARRAGTAFRKLSESFHAASMAFAEKFNRDMHHAGHNVTMQIVTREEHAAIHARDGYGDTIKVAREAGL